MSNSIRSGLAALALCFTASAAAQVGGVPLPAQSCQRECLEGFIDRYLAAMADNNVDPDLFTRDVRFTENGIELPLGNEGLWFSTVSRGNYSFYVPDIETQQIAFLGTVMEQQAASSATGSARPPEAVAIALRLRIADGKISEVEQIAARPERPLGAAAAAPSSSPFPATGAAVEAMGSPDPIFLEAVPDNRRHTRAELIAVGNAYFEGLQRNDGQGYYPFTDDCVRFENGIDVLGPRTNPQTGATTPRQSCKGQFENNLRGIVTSIRDRRFVAVDRERGIVFAFAFFDHRPINWTWQLGELFKVENGLIRRIEAVFIRAPYGINSGWSTYEQTRSEEIQDVR